MNRSTYNPYSYVPSPFELEDKYLAEIGRLKAENARLRAELAERSQVTSPIRLLNDLRAGLDATRRRMAETERWR
ncbi:MAG: hypothetical protein ACREMY_05320 [bacterium]